MKLVCRDCETTTIIDNQLTSCPHCGSFNIDIIDNNGSKTQYKRVDILPKGRFNGSKNLINAKRIDITGEKEIIKEKTPDWVGEFCCLCVVGIILLIIFIFFGEQAFKEAFEWLTP